MKKYFKFFARKPGLRLMTAVIIVLLGGAIFLGVLSAREMKRTISEDFNAQQLALAKNAAGILAQNFRILKRELVTLGLSPSIQYVEAVSWANRMKISLSSVCDYGVIQIMLIKAGGAATYSIDYTGAIFMDKRTYGHEEDYLEWCKKPENKGKVYISDAREGVVADSERGLLIIMATPVYQISSDEAHPVPTFRFSGVLAFVVDAGLLAKRFAGPIRSGKTGYAWVIDESGNFVYHLEKDFIGQNAFEVRKLKDPYISFGAINLIQKAKMLKGEEGTSWYISGWHRGVTGRLRKLIAYAPIHIGAANATRTWSVAVVAPISEVEEAVHAVYVRQAMIQGAIGAAVLVIFLFFIVNERAWLKTLQYEVKEKTKDLEGYARRLKDSEERYRSLVESADDMIYTMDKDCNILSINQYSRGLIRRRAEDIIGKNITGIIKHKEDDVVSSIVAKVFDTMESVPREERVKIGDREYWLDTKYKAVMAEGGMAVLVISRDITEQKNMEGQLFHTEKLASLGSLSAGVAHEINNPIAIILGFTEILLERFAEDSKEYEILKTIERQGNNCKRIVENLLAFSRIPKKTATQTNIVENLKKVLDMAMNTLVTEKVDLETSIKEDLPKVRGDGPQLEQVFLNIINNGVAAMDGGGILSISAHRSGNMVSIAFRDTGSGISSENIDKIFEPFFTTKKVGEGTGLGLSVSYGIVKKFGGNIQVKSQTAEEGKEPGTTFTVLLPVADEDTK